MDHTQHSNPLLFERPPFPPLINLDEFVKLKRDGTVPAMSSNSFMIYRKYYINNLKSQNVKVPTMTTFSPVIANSWRNESLHVKQYYERLADLIRVRFEEKFSIPGIRKKRDIQFESENTKLENEYKKIIYDLDTEVVFLKTSSMIKKENIKKKDKFEYGKQIFFNEFNDNNKYSLKEFEKNNNTIYYPDRFIPIEQDIERQNDYAIHYPEYSLNDIEYKKKLYWYHISNRYYFLKLNHHT
ncbi:4831_t:CDS:2 [Scutellospora calospora]|uniref:4831_t:CDS:1 n=1 Tax=Scutellospora calospora TaxID=85575 RepID=A0ACA9M5A6_9GLOM|nr:4831_t:CDS:2 [Scutellospora calospora]